MDAFVISKLAFLLAVGVAGFVGSIVLGRLLVKQPEQLRVALWWLLAVILAAVLGLMMKFGFLTRSAF